MPPALDNEHRSRRYHDLVHELADELGHKYGWRAAVAARLGIAASYLTKIIDGAGERRVGVVAVRRARERLGLLDAYFNAPAGTPRTSFTAPKPPPASDPGDPDWYAEAHELKLQADLLIARGTKAWAGMTDEELDAADHLPFEVAASEVEEVAARLLNLPVLRTATLLTSPDEVEADAAAARDGERFLRETSRFLLSLLAGERFWRYSEPAPDQLAPRVLRTAPRTLRTRKDPT